MTDPNLTADAVRRFRQRADHLLELIGDDGSDSLWADVLITEACFLAEEGPAAYVRYVERMDQLALRQHIDDNPAAVCADLDAELSRILGGES